MLSRLALIVVLLWAGILIGQALYLLTKEGGVSFERRLAQVCNLVCVAAMLYLLWTWRHV